jgi:AcrR family transcriptional regulator
MLRDHRAEAWSGMLIDQKMSRQRILEGAIAILDSGRCADLTVDALARSLHMSKSTLYKYFSSKEDVIVALVKDACDSAEAEVARALAHGPASRQLAELASAIGRHGQRLPRAVIIEAGVVVPGAQFGEPPFRPSSAPGALPAACTVRMHQTRDVFANAASTVVDRGVDSGEFKCGEPRIAAIAFVASAEAVLVDGARRGIQPYGERVGTLPALFLPGLTT